MGADRRLVEAGDPVSRAVIQCLSLANGRRQLPLVIQGPGTGDGARAPLAQPAAPVAMSGAPVARKERTPASAPKLSFPGPRPQPPASRAGPYPAPSFRGRAGMLLTRGGGPEGAGGRIRRPGRSEQEPAQARRRRLRRLGPRQPAPRPPPRWPGVPARPPRAPRRSRSGTRPREQRVRAPSLPAGPGARRPRPRRRSQPLTRCLRRLAVFRLGRRSPPHRPRRSEGYSARPSHSPP